MRSGPLLFQVHCIATTWSDFPKIFGACVSFTIFLHNVYTTLTRTIVAIDREPGVDSGRAYDR